MPHVHVSTNATIAAKVGQKLLADIVALTETHLGKPKNVTMARIDSDALVWFAGSVEPAAHVHVQAIGLPTVEARTALVAAISGLLDEVLGVPHARAFVTFVDIPADQWGVHGKLVG